MQTLRPARQIRTIAGLVAALLLLDLTALVARPAEGDAMTLTEPVAPQVQDTAPASPSTLGTPPSTTTTTSTPTTTSTTSTTSTAPPTTAPAPVASTAPAPPPTTTPPPTTIAAVPAPAPRPASARQESPEQRVSRAFQDAVPAEWRADIPAHLEIIEGSTSWADGNGRILVSETHANGGYDHLVDVLGHEFGHLIAFRYGTRAYPGAAPEGWPEPPSQPAEAWADCVQTSFTGRANPSHGLPICSGEQLDWARTWVGAGPPR